MHRLKWLVLAPVALVVVVFSVANRQFVTISFEPLPGGVELPLFAVAFIGIAAGFVLGAIGAWWAGRGGRKQARADRRTLRDLTKKAAARGGALQVRDATPDKVESLAREQ
jgi:uncharacterized integral membrane protein